MPKKRRQPRKDAPKKCDTKYCRNLAYLNGTFCSKCQRRNWAKNHPIEYTLATLRGNAKRRGKEFSLTIEEFTKWCNENDYIRLKGQSSTSMTIDRNDPNEGYHIWNLKIMTNAENVRKMHIDKKYNGTAPINYKPPQEGDDNFVPF